MTIRLTFHTSHITHHLSRITHYALRLTHHVSRPASGLSRPLFPLAAITALAALVRLSHLGAKGLWADEIFTAVFAEPANSWGEVTRRALETPIPSPPLWFWITHAFLLLFGKGDAIVRLPSALAGILGVPVLYLVGRRLFDAPTGLIAALLLAVAPLHVYHSQEARFYAVVPLLSLVALYGLWDGLTQKRTHGWVLFTLAPLLGLYIHLTTFLVLAAEVTFAGYYLLAQSVGAKRRLAPFAPTGTTLHDVGRRAAPLVASLAVIALAYLPMVPYLIVGATGKRGLGNPNLLSGLPLSPARVAVLAAMFGAGTGWGLALYGAAFLVGLGDALRRRRAQAVLILTWMTVPFLVVALLRPRHWFAPKYVISIMPIYLLTVAWGVRRVSASLGEVLMAPWGGTRLAPVRGLSTLVMVLLYAGMNVSGIAEVRALGGGPWRDLGRVLRANVQPGDVVAFTPLPILTMSPGMMLGHYYPFEAQGVTVTTVRTREELQNLLDTYRRVWLVELREWTVWDEVNTAEAGVSGIKLGLPGRGEVNYMGQGQTPEALLAEVMQFRDLPAEAWGSIGKVYANRADWGNAAEAYKRAVAAAPEKGIWHYHLAQIYEAMGDFMQAEAKYKAAIRLEPAVPGFHAALADLYARTGRPDLAVRAYRRAIDLYREHYPADTQSPYLMTWQERIEQNEVLGVKSTLR